MPHDYEFEVFLGEFKRRIRGDKGPPSLDYREVHYLLDLWHEGKTPQEAVDIVKELMANGFGQEDYLRL